MARNIEMMVGVKVKSAYRLFMVPCVVEYAGLIFTNKMAAYFPGGLTQEIWSALGARGFISFAGKGRKVTARAVVGYCDGQSILTFVGDTSGTITDLPAGTRNYDWDTIFCPDGEGGKTYSQIYNNNKDGLAKKVELSQSTKAMEKMFHHLIQSPTASFFWK